MNIIEQLREPISEVLVDDLCPKPGAGFAVNDHLPSRPLLQEEYLELTSQERTMPSRSRLISALMNSLWFAFVWSLPTVACEAQTQRTVSGLIELDAGALSGVWVTGLPSGTVTATDGTYQVQVPDGWVGTVEPWLPGYRFEPSSVDLAVNSDISLDFIAFEHSPGRSRLWLADSDDGLRDAETWAEEEDLVVLLPGTYSASLGGFEDGVTLLGRGGADQVLLQHDLRVLFNGRYQMLDGLTFESTNPAEPGLHIAGAENLRVLNCRFRATDEGVRVDDSANLLFEGSHWNASHHGVLIHGFNGTSSDDFVFRQSSFTDHAYCIGGGTNPELRVILENLNLRNFGSRGVDFNGMRSVAVNNVIFDDLALDLGSTEGLALHSITESVEVSHSVFAGHFEALSVSSGVDVELHDSIFVDNQKAVDGSSSASVSLDHVMYTDGWLYAGPQYDRDFATIWEEDPLFIDPSGGDFMLAIDSPARNAGREGQDLGAYGGRLGDAWSPPPSLVEPQIFDVVFLVGPRHLAVGEMNTYQVEGHFERGYTGEVEVVTQWSSTNEAVLRSVGGGAFEALQPGSARVVVDVEGFLSELEIQVSVAPPSSRPPGSNSLHLEPDVEELRNVKDAAAGEKIGSVETVDLMTQKASDEASGWAIIDALRIGRAWHTATSLLDGRILVAGGVSGSTDLSSVEIFDPLTASWSTAAPMAEARYHHTATLLPDGRVLVVGGRASTPWLGSAELYDPWTDSWVTAAPPRARREHTATLLQDGTVLIAGGSEADGGAVSSAQLYDPVHDIWYDTGPMKGFRYQHSATMLASSDNRVLVVDGGQAETYDPETFSWTLVAEPQRSVNFATATLLADGRVLVTGGYPPADLGSEVYDPVNDSWTPTGLRTRSRGGHSAVLLPDGRVLIAGGDGDAGDPVETEVFDPDTLTWASAGSLSSARERHTMSLLPSGQVLLAGGSTGSGTTARCEVYQPTFGSVSPAADLVEPRFDFVGAIQSDGKVMVAAGRHSGYISSAELYDPMTDDWSPATHLSTAGSLRAAVLLADGDTLVIDRYNAERYRPASATWSLTGPRRIQGATPVATLLPSGKVLVVTRIGAETYDPVTDTWQLTGAMRTLRDRPTLTIMTSGLVLAVGGKDGSTQQGTNTGILPSAELYDPESDQWLDAGSMRWPRRRHVAVPLPSGEVLVIGGDEGELLIDHAEIYDPVADSWRLTSSTSAVARRYATAVLSTSGQVWVIGGNDGQNPLASTEIYDPLTDLWRPGPNLAEARERHGAFLMASGDILVVGGRDAEDRALGSVERLRPFSWPSERVPLITDTSLELRHGEPLTLTGLRFGGGSEAGGGGTQQSAAHHPAVLLQDVASGRLRWLSPDPLATVDGMAPTFWQDPMTLTIPELPIDLDPGYHRLSVVRAGVPSAARLLPFRCSLVISDPPMDQFVALGGNVMFTVEARGARSFQWYKNDLPISGATSASYTTPPVDGSDSGAVYSVVVRNLCGAEAEASAILTVVDDEPPTAAVQVPRRGQFWTLPIDPQQQPRFETVAWTMADNIRVCQVRVALEFSADGDSGWSPAPDEGGLPATFGSPGGCPAPGETIQNTAYELPLQPPSGSPGSSYRIELRVMDHLGLESVVYSDPFSIVRPDPSAVKTLIVTHMDRMQQQQNLTDQDVQALEQGLRALADHPRVAGLRLDLSSHDGLECLVQAWDSAVEELPDNPNGFELAEVNRRANELLFGESETCGENLPGIHDHIQTMLEAFTGIEHLVLVGDDRTIPMARLPDRTSLYDETNYPDPLQDAGLDASDPLPMTLAMMAGLYLSDDPMAMRGKVDSKNLDFRLFLPDLAIGRLVERPQEILASIDAFLQQDGVLLLEDQTVLVSAYDFLTDSGRRIRDDWQARNMTVTELIGNDWDEVDLKNFMCGDLAPPSLLSLNGHAVHYGEGVPGEGPQSVRFLPASELLDPEVCDEAGALDLRGRVIYAVGCHGGLSVPGSDASDPNHSLDLPQTFLGLGAVAYVANSGYGWGLRYGIGYSERLMQILTEELARGGTISIGRAIAASKLRYFLEVPYFDRYDEKTLMQWTTFGLPMYAIHSASVDGAPELPSLSIHDQQVSRELTVQFHGDDPTKASNPANLLIGVLSLDLSAEDLYEKWDADGNPVADAGCTHPEGCYYELNGLAAARSSGTGDLPLLPYLVYETRLAGTSQHGVLWLGGSYVQETNWRPILNTLVSNGGDGSDHSPIPQHAILPPIDTRWVRGQDPTDACRPTDLEFNSLVVVAGETLEGPQGQQHGTHRRYTEIDLELFYLTDDALNSCDREGPEIAAGPLNGTYHETLGSRVQWQVSASDEAGVWRLVVVYTTGATGDGAGQWYPVELELDSNSGLWTGGVDLLAADKVNYVIQAVDRLGNVSWLEWASVGLQDSGTGIEVRLPEVVEVPLEPGVADLSVDSSDTQDPVSAGAQYSYRVNVGNAGPTTAANVVVIDTLPAGVGFLSASGTGWLCAESGGVVTCTRDSLAVGVAPPITISVMAPSSAGVITNTVTVSAVESDPVSADNSDSETTTVSSLSPSISVTATAFPTSVLEPGGLVALTIQVENTCQTVIELTGLSDDVHGDLDGQGTCSLPQTIPIGGAYQCQFSAPIIGNAGDSEIVTVNASGLGAGELVTGSDSATIAITDALPAISLTLVAFPSSIEGPEGSVTFTVEVNNTGDAEAVELVSLEGDLDGNLDGLGTCSLPQTIPVGGFYSCDFSATVVGSAGDIEIHTIAATVEDDELNTVSVSDSATVTIVDSGFMGQFQVNTSTEGSEGFPAIGADEGGAFTIVWEDFESGAAPPSDIRGQRFSSEGLPTGNEFLINAYSTGNQFESRVAVGADGHLVVVWTSDGSPDGDSDGLSIQGQRLDSSGSPVGDQFQINTYTPGLQQEPAVAGGPEGEFVVVWSSTGSDGTDASGSSVQAQRFDSAGNRVGGEFQVNTTTYGDQSAPAVAVGETGEFVVVWQSDTYESDVEILVQRYDSAGMPRGGELTANTGLGVHRSPEVDSAGDSFVVVWDSDVSTGTDSDAHSVQARLFDNEGNALGDGFQVNSYIEGDQQDPAVSTDPHGNFVVVWSSAGSSGDDSDSTSIQGQWFDHLGAPLADEFQVNVYTTGGQDHPGVTADTDGDFVVTWHSEGSPGDDDSETSVQAIQLHTDISGIELVKSGILDLGSDDMSSPGDLIDYTFDVINRGNVTLSNVFIDDPLLTVSCPVGNPFLNLSPGERVKCNGSYVITQADIDAGRRDNTATVIADNPEGHLVSAQDSYSVIIPSPEDPRFVCEGEALIIQNQNAQLTKIDQSVSPFVFVDIGGPTGLEINALGFRGVEGMLYGVELSPSGNVQIVRIDAAGTVTGLGRPPGLPPSIRFDAGDVSPDGSKMYVTAVNRDLYQLDLTALPTWPAVTTIEVSGSGGFVFDWAMSPTDGKLYGGDSTHGQLAVLDPATGVRSDVNLAGLNSGAGYGGAWFDAAGQLFLYQNDGHLYEIDITGPMIVNTQTGPGATRNDGTACIDLSTPSVAIELVKTGTLDLGNNGEVDPGDVIDYSFEITNTGSETLTAVTINDPLVMSISCLGGHPIAALESGAKLICTGSYSINQADIDAGARSNTAEVTGDYVDGQVSDQDSHNEPIPQPWTPFTCTGDPLIVQNENAQLTEIDQSVTPFIFVPLGDPIGTEINNLGYRRTDNLLYGVELSSSGNVQILQIDSRGNTRGLGRPPGLPAGPRFDGGDVSPDGRTMYITANNQRLYRLDLTQLPVLPAVTSVAVSGASGHVFDWAVSPIDGMLYGGDSSGGQLARIDPATGQRTDVNIADLPSGSGYGGAWFDSAGHLFLYRNSGAIYEIDLSLAEPAVVNVQAGPGASRNDGAACVASPNVLSPRSPKGVTPY